MDEEAEASGDASEDEHDGNADGDGDGFERDFIDDASPDAGPAERCAALRCTLDMWVQAWLPWHARACVSLAAANITWAG